MRVLRSVECNGERLWLVEGESGVYVVSESSGQYKCTCPSFLYRRVCKHIDLVRGSASCRG
jgi:predicted nucleic acid-binding Zn finger protein